MCLGLELGFKIQDSRFKIEGERRHLLIHATSRVVCAVAVTIEKASWFTRVTVTSASYPPFKLRLGLRLGLGLGMPDVHVEVPRQAVNDMIMVCH